MRCCSSYMSFIFFFFSSRRRHTRLQGDWSSDVCSSDLDPPPRSSMSLPSSTDPSESKKKLQCAPSRPSSAVDGLLLESRKVRSEVRRVGKECRARWRTDG